MGSERIEKTTFVGHSGGYPGHITKTLLDPTNGLVVSVLTNAVDGPAGPLARGIAQLLVDARRSSEQGEQLGETARRHTGRYANLWHAVDVAAVGGRLLVLDPTSWTPLEAVDELVEEGPDRFRITAGTGYSSVGEPVLFAGPGVPEGGMRYASLAMTPLPELPE